VKLVNDNVKLLHRNIRKSRILLFETMLTLNTVSSVPSPSKCTKILGGLGIRPDPTGELTALPYLLAGLRGLLLRDRKRRGGEGREGKKTKGEWREGMEVVWNALPVYPRSTSISRGQFRAGLKTYLFNQAYNIL